MSVAPVPIHYHPQFRQISDEDRVPYDAEYEHQHPKPRRPRMSEPFVMASLKVLHKSGLSDGAKIVYLTLRHHLNPETGQCNPSIDRIADEVEKTPRSVMRLLDELESAGWITRERTNKTYNYTFPDEPVPVVRHDKNVTTGDDENVTSEEGSDLTNVSHPTGQKCHVRHDKNVTQSITKNKNKEQEQFSSSSTSEAKSPKKATVPNASFLLWRWWADTIKLPDKARPLAKDMGIAKQLVAQGIGPAEAERLYRFLVSDPFWAEKGVDLGIMLSQLGKWRSKMATPPPLPTDLAVRISVQAAENTHYGDDPHHIGTGLREKLAAFYASHGYDPEETLADPSPLFSQYGGQS